MAAHRPVPLPTPETSEFWAGTRVGELRFQRCRSCRHAYLPPRPWCPACASADVEVEVASGEGRVVSAVVSHLPAPGFETPFVLAVVELAEGPRLLTDIVNVAPALDRVPPGLAVEVLFEPVEDQVVALFQPRSV